MRPGGDEAQGLCYVWCRGPLVTTATTRALGALRVCTAEKLTCSAPTITATLPTGWWCRHQCCWSAPAMSTPAGRVPGTSRAGRRRSRQPVASSTARTCHSVRPSGLVVVSAVAQPSRSRRCAGRCRRRLRWPSGRSPVLRTGGAGHAACTRCGDSVWTRHPGAVPGRTWRPATAPGAAVRGGEPGRTGADDDENIGLLVSYGSFLSSRMRPSSSAGWRPVAPQRRERQCGFNTGPTGASSAPTTCTQPRWLDDAMSVRCPAKPRNLSLSYSLCP